MLGWQWAGLKSGTVMKKDGDWVTPRDEQSMRMAIGIPRLGQERDLAQQPEFVTGWAACTVAEKDDKRGYCVGAR